MIKRLASGAAAALLAATATTQAAGYDNGAIQPPGIEGEVGVAISVSPRYEGASDFLVGALPLIRLERLTLGNGFQIGGGRAGGFSVGPSFGVRGARRAADTPALTPLADVGRAFEFGVRVSHETEFLKLHANLRRGFGGHTGWTGEAGADLIARPRADLKLYAGPRVSYADGRYMDTYFSVPAGTAGFAAFDAGGGLKSYGVEVGARYELSPQWALEGMLAYDRLTGDAAASPITAIGTRDQVSARLGIVRKFRFDF